MKVGFLGLGKLGLPCALAIEKAGHHVKGFDPSPEVQRIVVSKTLPYREEKAEELLLESSIEVIEPEELAKWADILFVAVQTPHQEQYEGITKLPPDRADFSYSWLREAVESVAEHANTVVVISTVLPGTIEREIKPLIDEKKLLYNPFFIAMGTTIPDFVDPEFVLVGTDLAPAHKLKLLYSTIHSKPVFVTTIKTAELTKVAYNTFIGLKIAFANTMMEICEKTGADIDDLVDALSLAKKRIISPAYLRGGMGDGGGCHPRDNIALSWLARELDLSYDLFEALMISREKQTEWIAQLAMDEDKPIEILGKAYKPETNLTVGSPALLLASFLEGYGYDFSHKDPYT